MDGHRLRLGIESRFHSHGSFTKTWRLFLTADAVGVVQCLDIELAVDRDRCAVGFQLANAGTRLEAELGDIVVVVRFLVAELDDGEVAQHGEDIGLAIADERGTTGHRAKLGLPKLFAGLGIEAEEFATVFGDVQFAIGQCRGSEAEAAGEVLVIPHDLGFAILHDAHVEAGHTAERTAAGVLFPVADVDEIPFDHRAGVHDACAEVMAPDTFTGSHLQRMHATIRRTAYDQPLTVHHGDDRVAVVGALQFDVGLLECFGGTTPPHHFTGLAVERHEPAVAAGLIAPTTVDQTQDHQAFVVDGRGNPPTVAGHPAEFFGQLAFPKLLACLGIQGQQEAGGGVGEHGAGFRVGRHARPAKPTAHDVGVEHAEAVVPLELAGLGIQAYHSLAFGGLVGIEPVDEVHLAVHHQRCGTPTERLLPEQVVLAHGGEFKSVRQFLLRDAVLCRPTPVQPIVRMGGGSNKCGECQGRCEANHLGSLRVRVRLFYDFVGDC